MQLMIFQKRLPNNYFGLETTGFWLTVQLIKHVWIQKWWTKIFKTFHRIYSSCTFTLGCSQHPNTSIIFVFLILKLIFFLLTMLSVYTVLICVRNPSFVSDNNAMSSAYLSSYYLVPNNLCIPLHEFLLMSSSPSLTMLYQ